MTLLITLWVSWWILVCDDWANGFAMISSNNHNHLSRSTSHVVLSANKISSSIMVHRRSMMVSTVSSLIGSGTFAMIPKEEVAIAATTTTETTNHNNTNPNIRDYTIHPLTVSIPTSWKVTVNNNNNGSKNVFSAIDFQSGSVITIVKERACNVSDYAKSSKTCDFILPNLSSNNSNDYYYYSPNTIDKDITKLLIRHDDRDNLVLQGTTRLDFYKKSNVRSNTVVDIDATTTIPTSGTYRDTMGIDRPNTIDRKVKAKSIIVPISNDDDDDDDTVVLMTLWLTAPLDEWQKPVMGTKLNQVWQSIQYNSNPNQP